MLSPRWFVVCAVGVSACTKDSDDHHDPVQRRSLSTPLTYSLEDPACQDQDGAQIGAQPVWQWNGNAGAAVKSELNVDGRTSAKSTLISATGYDYHSVTEQDCQVDDTGAVACGKESDGQVLSAMKELKLCRPTGPYRRDSVEGVTLATIANLERALAAYSAIPGVTALGSAKLYVMPNYEQLINATQPSTGKSATIATSKTDNAGFGVAKKADGSDQQVYIVFPKSLETSKEAGWGDVNLWEIPWVMAHEFSHQVFYNHYTNFHADSDALGIWKRREGRQDGGTTGFGLTATSRNVTTDNALTAVNEGFADLLGAHLLGATLPLTKNLPCFAKTRDITSAYFADGKRKALNDSVYGEFFAKEEKATPSDCNVTDIQDEHHMGAIFAYGVNRLIGNKGAAGVIAWIDAFDAERKKTTAPSADEIFALALKSAVKVAKGNTESLSNTQCAVMADVFPHYEGDVASGCP